MSEHIVITGGTGGLGSAIRQTFETSGQARITSLGSKDLPHADKKRIDAFFAQCQCDLLVCCAGIIRDCPLAKMTAEDWDEVLNVNFRFASYCAVRALRGMQKVKHGHIIFITSYAARHPAVGQAAYAAAKASLEGLTRQLATQGGPHNIRVNAVAPGFLETNMTAAVSPQRKSKIRDLHRLGRFNTPEVAAQFIHHLHYRMPYTSGQVFSIDSRPSG